MKGRKPLPLKLRMTAGEDTGELLAAAGPPVKPLWLSTRAAEEWDRIVPVLAAKGMVCNLDTVSLATYCETYSQWRDAVDAIKKNGIVTAGSQGQARVNPASIIAREGAATLLRLAGEFGFTPLARSRVGNPPGEAECDELQGWLRGNAS